MANIITGIRILCSIALLFCRALSPTFYLLYVVAGFTDMIDGWVARQTNTVSDFGAKWDTMADIVFVVCCLIKLISIITIPLWLCIWIGIIACIKFFNMGYGFVVQKKLVAVHNMINKITGFLLFLFPLTWSFIDMRYSAVIVCMVATYAAALEGKNISAKHIAKTGTLRL